MRTVWKGILITAGILVVVAVVGVVAILSVGFSGLSKASDQQQSK